MDIEAIHLIGAGGHAAVVADALLSAGTDIDRIVVRDGRDGLSMLGRPVATPELVTEMAGALFHVAIGLSASRAHLHRAAVAAGARPMTILHPNATVAEGVALGEAIFVGASAVIAPAASVGNGTIVNHGAIIDHDSRVGDFCHIAPNATVGGGVTIGEGVMVGAGAVILPGISIADYVTIGAGAVVIRSIDEPGTWIGNPAIRLIK